MKLSILSILNVIILINGEHSSYNQYTEKLKEHDEQPEIPSLKSLFNYTSYRDKLNKTSPCLYDEGHKRDIHCEMVSYFDEEGYERSLQETRNFILNRLNLDSEPEIKLNKNTLSFLDQLENKILNDNQETVLDKNYGDLSSSKKVLNTIHEAVGISTRCSHSKYSSRDKSHLCITFDIPTENLVSSNGIIRRPTAAYLWLFMRTQSSYEYGIDENFHLEISNDNKYSNSEIIYNLRYGWKKINISKIFKIAMIHKLKGAAVVKYTIKLRCFYDCSIGFTERDIDNYFYDDKNILISNHPGKKPLLSIDIEEENEIEYKRNKRRISTVDDEENFRSTRHSGYTTKTCRHSSNNKERECCLNQYQVDFDRLKWSNWIVSPTSYSANFCSGRCNDPRSI